ncbi:MAG TPA: hypothetical protein VGH99_14655 [Pseudonocardia sp.]|jgi:hypothetical protein
MPVTPPRPHPTAPCPSWCVHHDRTPTWLRHSEHVPGSAPPGAIVRFRERVDHRGGVGVETMILGRVPSRVARAAGSDAASLPTVRAVEVHERLLRGLPHPAR